VLFVDEVHRLPRTVEEVLYPAMEDFQLDIVVGKGPGARSIRLDLPRFTLVGATTRTGLIASPLRDRFGFSAHLEHYEVTELERIVTARPGCSASPIDAGGAARDRAPLARHPPDRQPAAAPGPRLRRGRGRRHGRPRPWPDAALEVFDVDELGLDRLDRRVLEALVDRFGGGPVGLATLATAVGEEPDTVEDAVEPFLMRCGLLQRTPRGRIATAAAYRHRDLPDTGGSVICDSLAAVRPPSGGRSPAPPMAPCAAAGPTRRHRPPLRTPSCCFFAEDDRHGSAGSIPAAAPHRRRSSTSR
jgi:holliday junction DNA helicase RuvB